MHADLAPKWVPFARRLTVVYSPVFDLWGRYSFGALAGIAFAIMGVQLAGANLWLRVFATGPLEWLWKSLAYNRRQPFRRAISGAEVMS